MDVKLAILILVHFMFLVNSGLCKSIGRVRKSDIEKNSEALAVKTIQTETGDIFDCIDFYEQPSLKHPSLKNHNFHPQMRPSSSPKRMTSNAFPGENIKEPDLRLKDGGCPAGTVPIIRIGKDELDEFMLLKQNSSSSRADPNPVYRRPGTIFAVAQTQWGTRAYHGAGASLSIYNPVVGRGQYSSAQITIQGGSDMIEFGWTVNPILFKDSQTRLFLYSTAGKTHCFNSHCGFVIVDTEIPLGGVFPEISVPDGNIYVFDYFVYQDEKNGCWWLELGKSGTIIGFWPKQFFTGLAPSASYSACGGEIYMPPGGDTTKPEMGSGHRAYYGDPTREAFCHRYVFVNEAHQVVHASGTDGFSTDGAYYTVADNSKKEKPAHIVFFGGPYPG